MEGKEEAGVTEYSRVSELGNWMVGVLSFTKIGRLGVQFPNFLFLQVRKLNLPNIIQKVSDHWHYKLMSSDSLPTNCFVHTRMCTHTHGFGFGYACGAWQWRRSRMSRSGIGKRDLD